MPRLTRIEAEYHEALQRASVRFGDHEGVTEGRVLAWLAQFADDDIYLGIRVLAEIRYFAASNIRAMVRELRRSVAEELEMVPRNRVVFVPVGEVGGGASIIARVLRGLRGEDTVRVVSMVDLADFGPDDLDAVVFVDDLSVTGDTLIEWWENVEPIVLPLAVEVVMGALIMTTEAEARLREFARPVVTELMGAEANVLSAESAVFDEVEKVSLLGYCDATGCGDDYLRGYGGAGLLLAFKHGCPNNSLPILWHESDGWQSLFRRRAI
jgi:hypothetical protein